MRYTPSSVRSYPVIMMSSLFPAAEMAFDAPSAMKSFAATARLRSGWACSQSWVSDWAVSVSQLPDPSATI